MCVNASFTYTRIWERQCLGAQRIPSEINNESCRYQSSFERHLWYEKRLKEIIEWRALCLVRKGKSMLTDYQAN